MAASAFITGLSGANLTPDERAFLRASEPAGLIVFKRNCQTRSQLYRLIGEARDAIGREDTLVLVDQEGARVQRLQPPEWRALPDARQFGTLFQRDPDEGCAAAMLVARLIAHDLAEVGINTNCMPVLDVPTAGAHGIIGPRAFATDADAVATLARAFADGLEAGGIVPVGKHVPGHGRATADTHHDLATVINARDELETTDFAPFRALSALPAMMTAHVVFSDIDDTEPASTSARMHDEIIRRHIGFDGLLMSDDISMAALDGPLARRAERVLAAGSDVVLHCNGELSEMEAVAGVAPPLSRKTQDRLAACMAITASSERCDEAEAIAAYERVMELPHDG